jgi:RHS repeat-associated protein
VSGRNLGCQPKHVDGQSLLGGIAWQPFGGSRGWTQGNGRGVARTYDRDGRLVSHSLEHSSRALGYDAKGRLITAAEPWGTRSWGYDAADRLASEAGWAGTFGYTWDGNGNRLTNSGPLGSTGYGYEAGTNRLQSASGLDARSISHDAAGNQTVEGGYGFGYDARNRLAQATSPTTSTSYSHDAIGRRVLKSGTAGSRYFAHDEQRRVIGEYDAAATLSETVWLGSMPVAVLRGGQTYWIDSDQIDAPRAVLDANNQVVWRWRSEAFGNTQAEDNPSGLGVFEFNHRLPGQLFDAESALHHNDHRDYRAHSGRYVESDPIGLRGGLNRFGYADADPQMRTDPEGLQSGGPNWFMTFTCRRLAIPTEPDKCLDSNQCFDKAAQGLSRCQPIMNVLEKWACLYCWKIYQSSCPGKTPDQSCLPAPGLACIVNPNRPSLSAYGQA